LGFLESGASRHSPKSPILRRINVNSTNAQKRASHDARFCAIAVARRAAVMAQSNLRELIPFLYEDALN
jgi:hypothetical protein